MKPPKQLITFTRGGENPNARDRGPGIVLGGTSTGHDCGCGGAKASTGADFAGYLFDWYVYRPSAGRWLYLGRGHMEDLSVAAVTARDGRPMPGGEEAFTVDDPPGREDQIFYRRRVP